MAGTFFCFAAVAYIIAMVAAAFVCALGTTHRLAAMPAEHFASKHKFNNGVRRVPGAFFVYRKPCVRRGVPESLSDKEMIIKIPPLIK